MILKINKYNSIESRIKSLSFTDEQSFESNLFDLKLDEFGNKEINKEKNFNDSKNEKDTRADITNEKNKNTTFKKLDKQNSNSYLENPIDQSTHPLINIEQWADSNFSLNNSIKDDVHHLKNENKIEINSAENIQDNSNIEILKNKENNSEKKTNTNESNDSSESKGLKEKFATSTVLRRESSNYEDFDHSRKSSGISLKVPKSLIKRSSVEKKMYTASKLTNSDEDDSRSTSFKDSNSNLSHISSYSNILRSTESIYDYFNINNELGKLAEKYKKFYYDILNYGSQINVFKITMSRENVLEDSYCFLSNLKSKFVRTQFLIKFTEEEGVDYGGVGKEWFHLLSSEIFKPDYGLFEINSQNNLLDINKWSLDIIPV